MKLIVAYRGKDRGIGNDNTIPWHISEDLLTFKTKTTNVINVPNTKIQQSIVVMGRKTWDSIPIKFRPLKNRLNYVVSTNTSDEFKHEIESHQNTFLINNLDIFLKSCSSDMNDNIWIIGGAKIYEHVLKTDLVNEIHVTEIYPTNLLKTECDVFFPVIDTTHFAISNVTPINETVCGATNDIIHYRYITYIRSNSSLSSADIWNSNETQYLDTLREILNTGQKTADRTGVGTLSIFGKQFKYDLAEGLPVLTTKRVFLRAVFEELMLYLRGQTDNRILQEKGIHIWDGNTSREFLDSRNLAHYPEGDMGETYGFNFRHFGGEYSDCEADYGHGNGFDQLEYVINEIKTNPHSRRIIINLWNPNTLHKAALPSCLCQYQFYVNLVKNTLNLQIYIRSSDFFLANNWNTCTGAFFVYMLCNLEGIDLMPGELTVVTGDTHLYLNHLDGVRENLERQPRPQPVVKIKEKQTNIWDFKWEDLEIIGYLPQKNIKVEMAV